MIHDDVLVATIRCLTDRTLVNFSLACRHFFELSQSTLARRKLRIFYSTLDLLLSCDNDPTYLHPVQVIQLIQAQPDIVRYVRRIKFTTGIESFTHPLDPTPVDVTAYPSSIRTLVSHVDALSFLDEDSKQDWRSAIEAGSSNPAFVVLLSLCKNARTMHVCCGVAGFSTFFTPVVQHLCAGDPGGLFPKLKRLDISHWDTEGGFILDRLPYLLLIPTLRKLNGNMVGYGHLDRFVWPSGREAACQIQTVVFESSNLSPPTLRNIIRGMPKLRHLEYDDYYSFRNGYGQDVEADMHVHWNSVQEYLECLRNTSGNLFTDRGWLTGSGADSDTDYIMVDLDEPEEGENDELP